MTSAAPDAIRIVHVLSAGRLRLHVPQLRSNRALAARLAALAARDAAWIRAEVRALTGSVILHHDPRQPSQAMVARLAALIDFARGEAPAPAPGAATRAAGADGDGWHARPAAEASAAFGGDPVCGLDAATLQARSATDGPNLMSERHRASRWAMLAGQFRSLPVMMLGGSAVISVATGGAVDAVATLAVLAANGVLGFVTEGQAESVIDALAADDAHHMSARVIRMGKEHEIPAADLVRGDLYLVGPGTQVMADARLLRSRGLRLDESTLTGETLPVAKTADAAVATDAPVGSRPTMLHAGSVVAEGRGTAIVVETGDGTVAARIAALGAGAERPRAPVEAELDRLGRRLAYASLVACGAMAGIGWLRGVPLAAVLRDAVALAVAAVPEGLPVVATTTMALGLRRMERQGILIRRIDAVEALGALQTICLDKTGTLTQNRMQVIAAVPGLGEVPLEEIGALTRLAEAAALNNDAVAEAGPEGGGRASATEMALIGFARDCGIDVEGLRARWPRRMTVERTPERPWMVTVHEGARGCRTVMKGAPDTVLARCTHLQTGGRRRTLTDADRATIRAMNERQAARPARVLGFAEGRVPPDGEEVGGLSWLGLVGMVDPLRPGARDFIAAMHRAGLETVMITGDQSATAGAIARDLGLMGEAPLRIIDAPSIATMEPALLSALARQTHVFARVSADQKLAIVQALQAAGRVVAMTGDGVNDAPALKAADIGIAMGASGTDLARDVANVVIRDDELTTLIAAIGQGRAVYRNIRRALEFLITTNMSEIMVGLVEALHGPGELETPLELLWVNLATDVLPGLGLALADPDADVMAVPPRGPKEPILPRAQVRRMGIDGTVIAGAALTSHFIGLARHGPGPQTRGMTFLALSLGQLLYTLTCQRSDLRKLRPDRLLENRVLDLAVLTSAGLALMPFVVPPLGRLLGVAPLAARDTSVALAAAAFPALSVLARRGIALELHPLEEATCETSS